MPRKSKDKSQIQYRFEEENKFKDEERKSKEGRKRDSKKEKSSEDTTNLVPSPGHSAESSQTQGASQAPASLLANSSVDNTSGNVTVGQTSVNQPVASITEYSAFTSPKGPLKVDMSDIEAVKRKLAKARVIEWNCRNSKDKALLPQHRADIQILKDRIKVYDDWAAFQKYMTEHDFLFPDAISREIKYLQEKHKMYLAASKRLSTQKCRLKSSHEYDKIEYEQSLEIKKVDETRERIKYLEKVLKGGSHTRVPNFVSFAAGKAESPNPQGRQNVELTTRPANDSIDESEAPEREDCPHDVIVESFFDVSHTYANDSRQSTPDPWKSKPSSNAISFVPASLQASSASERDDRDEEPSPFHDRSRPAAYVGTGYLFNEYFKPSHEQPQRPGTQSPAHDTEKPQPGQSTTPKMAEPDNHRDSESKTTNKSKESQPPTSRAVQPTSAAQRSSFGVQPSSFSAGSCSQRDLYVQSFADLEIRRDSGQKAAENVAQNAARAALEEQLAARIPSSSGPPRHQVDDSEDEMAMAERRQKRQAKRSGHKKTTENATKGGEK